jgi:hypothetical protein
VVVCSLPLLGQRDPVNGAAMPGSSESCRRADTYHQVAIHRELLGDTTFVRASGHSTTDHSLTRRETEPASSVRDSKPAVPLKKETGEKRIPIQPNCPSVICGAGFFDDRYANTTTLIFRNSEKPGKGLDLGFRDNN